MVEETRIVDPARYPRLARIAQEARRAGTAGVAALAERVAGRLDCPPTGPSDLEDLVRFLCQAKGLVERAWREFVRKEDGMDLARLCDPEPDETVREWLATSGFFRPVGDLGFLAAWEFRAALDQGLVRALEAITHRRRPLTDEETEQIIARECSVALDQAYDLVLDGVWEDLNPEVREAVCDLWPKVQFRRAVSVLLMVCFTPSARAVLIATAQVRGHVAEEGGEERGRVFWRRVAEALQKPAQAAGMLEKRHERILRRVGRYLPSLAEHYERDPRTFDAFAVAEHLLRGALTPR